MNIMKMFHTAYSMEQLPISLIKNGENQLEHMIRFLVAENRKNKDQRALPDKEVENISTHLLSRIHHGSTSVVDSAALGLLVLTYTHPEAVKTDGFENIIQEGIIEKYPLNDYLQAAGNRPLKLGRRIRRAHCS